MRGMLVDLFEAVVDLQIFFLEDVQFFHAFLEVHQ
jgi:hypothetical protein